MHEIEVKPIEKFEDYVRCTELQKLIWKFNDRDLIPPRLYKLYQFVGGSVLGAYTSDNHLIGFTLAQPSFHNQQRAWHSNVLAVHPDFQNRRIGWLMKRAQRLEALKKGIPLITWTFDPLQARNAYLNLNRLGVCVRSYLKNAYGPGSSSSIHGRLGTDRVLAEWEIYSSDVNARMESINGSGPDYYDGTLPPCLLQWKKNDVADKLEATLPGGQIKAFCLEIPGDYANLLQSNIFLAREWRRKLRVLLISAFSQAYEIKQVARVREVDFVEENKIPWRTFYILEKC